MKKVPISHGNTWNTSEDFKSVGAGKVTSLKETVEEIEMMVTERRKLSDQFVGQAEKMKTNIDNFLRENAPLSEGDSEFTRERAELRKKQIEIAELQLNEHVGCWRDIALLKNELRDRTQELTEKSSRADMIEKILGEE